MHTFSLSQEDFLYYVSQGYNRIPISLELPADLETPLSLYIKLNIQNNVHPSGSFLLESVKGGERFGRYSFIGLPPDRWISTLNDTVGVWQREPTGEDTELDIKARRITSVQQNPLDFVDDYLKQFKLPIIPHLPRFCGGLVGYLGYDCVRHIEPRLLHSAPPDQLHIPDLILLQTEKFLVVDNLKGTLQLWICISGNNKTAYDSACKELLALKKMLLQPLQLPQSETTQQKTTETKRPFKKKDFMQAVEKIVSYIKRGDAMQVVLSQRLQQSFSEHPLTLYRAIRHLNPSPYIFYYDFGSFHVVGASPEILVRQENIDDKRKVTIRPLAGTRKRGATPKEDVALEKELLADEKERAEHLMLIDLARNDLGRVAKTGSVKLSDAFAIERYSHVMHITSNVEAEVDANVSGMDAFKASFPAGTLSGAPKVRAMEIIDELEPVKRGVYGGAVGHFSYTGDMDLAIAIRTAVIKNQMLYVQAGAGVVADSNAEAEWQESEDKARAVMSAVKTAKDCF